MRILIAPLNWGLGHASRCIPLIERYVADGHEVILGGDGESLLLLRKRFPSLAVMELASLSLRYSRGSSQVGAMFRAVPRVLQYVFRECTMTKFLDFTGEFDLILSDNRFGMIPPRKRSQSRTRYIYLTHQLSIRLPNHWHWAERIATALHRFCYRRYDEIWIPDFEDEDMALSGALGHPNNLPDSIRKKLHYIGPLSRMKASAEVRQDYDVVAVLSGLEPQRTLLEHSLIEQYAGKQDRVLIVRGRIRDAFVRLNQGNITLVPYQNDDELIPCLLGAKRIVARSGYTTIMDFYQLGLLPKSQLIPTPGQPEQEYLAQRLEALFAKKTP